MEEVRKAAELAKWLIEQKGVKRKTAYIIAQKKYRIESWQTIQRFYNQRLKLKQGFLI